MSGLLRYLVFLVIATTLSFWMTSHISVGRHLLFTSLKSPNTSQTSVHMPIHSSVFPFAAYRLTTEPSLSIRLTSFLTSRGIHLRLSCPYTSPQNGKAERVLRTLNNVTRTLLIHASMGAPCRAKALATATYLLNRHPCSAVQNNIPYQLLYS